MIRLIFCTKTTDWIDSFNFWIDSDIKRLNPDEGKSMKIDASQEMYETIQATQMDDWIDSRSQWIDSERVREFDDTTHEGMIRLKLESIQIQSESIHSKSETFWVDANRNESIHADKRHKWNRHKMFNRVL